MKNNMNCIFCNIIQGEIPSATIYENNEFKVILDRFPANEGHILIFPKSHVVNVFDINPEQYGRMFALAASIAQHMKPILGFEDLNVLQNNGEIAGQTVLHCHLHLIPRYKNDAITIEYEPLALSNDEIETMRLKLSTLI